MPTTRSASARSRHGGADGPLTREAPLAIDLPNGERDRGRRPHRPRRLARRAGRVPRHRLQDRERAGQGQPARGRRGAAAAAVSAGCGGGARGRSGGRRGAVLLRDAQAASTAARASPASISPSAAATSTALLGELHEGMRGGDFHAEPSDECRWCDFDAVCDKRRQAIRRAKASDPACRCVSTSRREEVP